MLVCLSEPIPVEVVYAAVCCLCCWCFQSGETWCSVFSLCSLRVLETCFHKSHRQESYSLVQDFCPYHSPCLKSLCKGLKCVAWQTTARFRIATKAHKRPKALQAYYIGDRISFATILGQSGTAAVFCSKKQRLAVMEFSEDEVLSRPWTCYELTTPTCFIYSLYSYHLYISLWYTYIPLNSIRPEPHKPGPYDAKKISCFLDRSVPTDWIRLGGSRHRSCNFIVVKLWNPFPWLFWNFFLLDVAKKWHKSHKPSGRLNEPKTQGHYNKLLLRVSESVHDLASQQQLRFATIRPVAVVACIQRCRMMQNALIFGTNRNDSSRVLAGLFGVSCRGLNNALSVLQC